MSATPPRGLVAACGVLGLTAVALGAFGAHALRDALDAEHLAWWETASRHHLVHALAIGVAALASRGAARAGRVAGLSFVAGVLVFSGTLYAMALGAPRWLGAVTPIGGVLLMVGWGALAWSARSLV